LKQVKLRLKKVEDLRLDKSSDIGDQIVKNEEKKVNIIEYTR